MNELDYLKETSKQCLENAKQYCKDAELLFSTNSFGHALTLIIFGEIELGKTVLYHIYSKGLLTKKILPVQFNKKFSQKNLNQLVNETWWIGFLLASNIQNIVPTLFTLCAYHNSLKEDITGDGLSPETKQVIEETIFEFNKENEKFSNFFKYSNKSAYVNLFLNEKKISSPKLIKKSLVENRINALKDMIENGEPFLSISFSKYQKIIAKELLNAAFESILPIRKQISHLANFGSVE